MHESIRFASCPTAPRVYFSASAEEIGVNRDILTQFYRAVIESVLTVSITVWYGSTTQAEKNSLDIIVRTASQIVGRQLPCLESIDAARTVYNSKDQKHPGRRAAPNQSASPPSPFR